MHGEGLHQGIAALLDQALDIGLAVGEAREHGIADAAADHVDVGDAADDLLDAPQLRYVHDEGHLDLFAQRAPAVDVGPDHGIFDKADDGRFFELGDDGQDGAEGAVVVEVPVQLKAGRGDFFSGSCLLDDIVAGVGMHLEDAIALVDGALHLGGEDVGRAGPGPGGDRHAVSDLLAEEFVARHAEVFAHQVVERHPQGQVVVVEQVVEGTATDQRVDLRLRGRIGVVFVVTVADEAVISGDFGDQVLVHVVHAHAAGVVVVAPGEGHGDGDLFDGGDFHLGAPDIWFWQTGHNISKRDATVKIDRGLRAGYLGADFEEKGHVRKNCCRGGILRSREIRPRQKCQPPGGAVPQGGRPWGATGVGAGGCFGRLCGDGYYRGAGRGRGNARGGGGDARGDDGPLSCAGTRAQNVSGFRPG